MERLNFPAAAARQLLTNMRFDVVLASWQEHDEEVSREDLLRNANFGEFLG
jgi:hypothetical protein